MASDSGFVEWSASATDMLLRTRRPTRKRLQRFRHYRQEMLLTKDMRRKRYLGARMLLYQPDTSVTYEQHRQRWQAIHYLAHSNVSRAPEPAEPANPANIQTNPGPSPLVNVVNLVRTLRTSRIEVKPCDPCQ